MHTVFPFFAPALPAFGSKGEFSLTCSEGNKRKKQSFTSVHKAAREVKYRLRVPLMLRSFKNGKLNTHVSPTQLKMVTFAISVNGSPPPPKQVNLCQPRIGKSRYNSSR